MYREMSAAEAAAQLPNMSVLDVREEYEAAQGTLEGAVHIPLSELPVRLGELSDSRTHLVVCQNGVRSAMATELLSQYGYEAVNLTGGLKDWTGDWQR
ncbi:rhodanese-like domain-containing protein [Ectobacillus ponti]|uniref:Rhodanese-like domain-containing protein n=1 Tax=Ectobacillus ponti TaxID=2961894 RepID=A0AA42BQ77_9BACI|nr:rhodanese-like domain-containing protein [Ectobacillus ponti]MCP8969116.1 rhodanese-like domain-containing protein [Ectobacillus ponti]